MTENLSGRDAGAQNLVRFTQWANEREASGDWADYVRQGKLNRSEIASECNFALSVLRQNPAVKAALEALETSLRERRLLGATPAPERATGDATAQAADNRLMAAKGRAEQRVKALEEQNAALRAEIHGLREQLARYKHLDEHLCRTGRILHP